MSTIAATAAPTTPAPMNTHGIFAADFVVEGGTLSASADDVAVCCAVSPACSFCETGSVFTCAASSGCAVLAGCAEESDAASGSSARSSTFSFDSPEHQ